MGPDAALCVELGRRTACVVLSVIGCWAASLAGGIPLASNYDNLKHLQKFPNVAWGAKSFPAETPPLTSPHNTHTRSHSLSLTQSLTRIKLLSLPWKCKMCLTVGSLRVTFPLSNTATLIVPPASYPNLATVSS